jgi:hypothetical protein
METIFRGAGTIFASGSTATHHSFSRESAADCAHPPLRRVRGEGFVVARGISALTKVAGIVVELHLTTPSISATPHQYGTGATILVITTIGGRHAGVLNRRMRKLEERKPRSGRHQKSRIDDEPGDPVGIATMLRHDPPLQWFCAPSTRGARAMVLGFDRMFCPALCEMT